MFVLLMVATGPNLQQNRTHILVFFYNKQLNQKAQLLSQEPVKSVNFYNKNVMLLPRLMLKLVEILNMKWAYHESCLVQLVFFVLIYEASLL